MFMYISCNMKTTVLKLLEDLVVLQGAVQVLFVSLHPAE